MSNKIEIPEYAGEPVDLEALGIRYGFRYDPMKWVNSDPGVDAALVRRNVFKQSLEGDHEVLEARIEELLAEEREKGWEEGEEGKLNALLDLGCPPDRPEYRDVLDRFCAQHVMASTRRPWFHQEAPTLCAAIRAGWQQGDEPKAMLARLVKEVNGDHLADCDPWAWHRTFEALWAGRHLVDVMPLIEGLLTYLRDNVNIAGCLIGGDPWNTFGAASVPEHPLCREVVAKYLPMILRSQAPNGGWGGASQVVLRAMANTGLLGQLCGLPPLPPDWREIRSIPAPEGKLYGLAWDGARLWTMNQDADEAIAITPEDGSVVKRLKVTLEGGIKVGAVGWYDDLLAVTAGGTEHHGGQSVLLLLDPEDGTVHQTTPIKAPWGPGGAAQVGDHLWITHYGWLCVVNPKTGEARDGHNPAAFPPDIAYDGESLWMVDSTAAYRMDLAEKLLEVPEKPGETMGMTYDGQNLWALNNEEKRITIIEKTESDRLRRRSDT